MLGSQRQDPLDCAIDVSPDFVALCRKLDGARVGPRMRALELMAKAYEAESRTLPAAA
jgi:hypothetical protein